MNDGTTFSASTQAELIAMIRTKIAPFAMPDYIQVDNLNIAYVCPYNLCSSTERAGPAEDEVREDHEKGVEEDC